MGRWQGQRLGSGPRRKAEPQGDLKEGTAGVMQSPSLGGISLFHLSPCSIVLP